MAMAMLDSEKGKLIYKYLSDTKQTLGETFLDTFKPLEECRTTQLGGKRCSMKFQGFTLQDLIDKDSELRSLVSRLSVPGNYVEKVKNILSIFVQLRTSSRVSNVIDDSEIGSSRVAAKSNINSSTSRNSEPVNVSDTRSFNSPSTAPADITDENLRTDSQNDDRITDEPKQSPLKKVSWKDHALSPNLTSSNMVLRRKRKVNGSDAPVGIKKKKIDDAHSTLPNQYKNNYVKSKSQPTSSRRRGATENKTAVDEDGKCEYIQKVKEKKAVKRITSVKDKILPKIANRKKLLDGNRNELSNEIKNSDEKFSETIFAFTDEIIVCDEESMVDSNIFIPTTNAVRTFVSNCVAVDA